MKIERRDLAMKMFWIALAIAAVAMSIWGATRSADGAETEEFPVWWSPRLEVESLDKVEARLARKFHVHGQLEAYRERNGVRETALMNSCTTTRRLADAGFEGIPYGLQTAILAECRAIELLADIRPAERSFVHNFVLDETAIPFLPIMFNAFSQCATLRDQEVLNAQHLPLTESEDVKEIETVEALSDGRLRYRTYTERVTIEILSRGDMTGDGLADLTVRLISSFIGGSGSGTDLFVVSRDGPRGVLYVVDEDAGRHGCRNY